MAAGTEQVGPDERFKPPARSLAVAREAFSYGAVITGRRTFDIARGWGGHHPFGCPFFVLTHNPPDRWVGPGTGGTAVTGGIDSALEQARAVAGDRVISVLAANRVQQFLRAGLLDEIRLDLVPVLLGSGVRLLDNLGGAQFDLRSRDSLTARVSGPAVLDAEQAHRMPRPGTPASCPASNGCPRRMAGLRAWLKTEVARSDTRDRATTRQPQVKNLPKPPPGQAASRSPGGGYASTITIP